MFQGPDFLISILYSATPFSVYPIDRENEIKGISLKIDWRSLKPRVRSPIL
ncbi:MAG: hypothetical protein WBM86_23765 [Waterburya sp.]